MYKVFQTTWPTSVVNRFSPTNDTTIPFGFYDTETHKVFCIFRSGGFMEKKMATPEEKAQCVELFIEMRSNTQVQRNFCTRYGRNLPSRASIREWYKGFQETGSCQKQKSTGRPSTSAADVERVCESFQQNPRKSR